MSDQYHKGNKSDPAEWVVSFQGLQQDCTHEGLHMFGALMVNVDFFLNFVNRERQFDQENFESCCDFFSLTKCT